VAKPIEIYLSIESLDTSNRSTNTNKLNIVSEALTAILTNFGITIIFKIRVANPSYTKDNKIGYGNKYVRYR
jgi:hypothetical protein